MQFHFSDVGHFVLCIFTVYGICFLSRHHGVISSAKQSLSELLFSLAYYLTSLLCSHYFPRYGASWSGYEASNGGGGSSETAVAPPIPEQVPVAKNDESESQDKSEEAKKTSTGFGDSDMDPSELAMLGIDPSDFDGFGK